MALQATATEVPGAWAVRLTATGATGVVTWVRDIGQRQTTVGDGADVVDRLVPLNTAVSWVAIDDVDSAVAGPVTVASDFPVLSSSMYGTAYQVTVMAQQPQVWRARSVWHPVIDREDGPIVSIFTADRREGDLVLDLPTRDLRTNLLRMLYLGDPLILRAVCPDRVDDLTILPIEWSDFYVTDGQWSGPQRFRIRYQSIAPEPPAWSPPAQWTYQDALTAHATYAEWLATYSTYDRLLAAVPG